MARPRENWRKEAITTATQLGYPQECIDKINELDEHDDKGLAKIMRFYRYNGKPPSDSETNSQTHRWQYGTKLS